MSGHSKWSTIKRKKEAEDKARGKLFSKLSRAISVAVKTGGSSDPDLNPKLRMAIEQAKTANMPKDNIERAIKKGEGPEGDLEEFTYEGFGPSGIGVIVEVATDNRNRTAQEIKNIFERGGGSLAGPGAVSFNFEPKGLLVVEKKGSIEEMMLNLIDIGAEDVEETDDGVEVYVKPSDLSRIRDEIQKKGYKVVSTDLFQKPKSTQRMTEEKDAKRILKLLDSLEDHDDVQNVFANVDVPEEYLENE